MRERHARKRLLTTARTGRGAHRRRVTAATYGRPATTGAIPGRERYLASPQADHTTSGASYLAADQITAWGRGITQVATLLAG
jgi:hypothetical protein